MNATHTERFPPFGDKDFEVFEIDGLETRMNALTERVRPKFQLIGERIAPFLSEACGEDMHPHVARHARRTVNPPNDSWIAFAPNKRGYKMHPHFQIGLWSTHVFVQFAVIYECPDKDRFAERALAELDSVRRAIPAHFVWSKDHMVPTGHPHGELTKDGLAELFVRLKTVKAAELTCGIHVRRGDPLLADGEAFMRRAEETFRTLLPLYRMARS
ncbi:YktB family protein [Paenibacillaceae bacterium WGS1546]|uniref:YktB family protein n=1 Tax=Cohnella sp. WGS1546 TaxID=3366810 RepID=UPI00372D6484